MTETFSSEELIKLREACLKCWSKEISTWFPKATNRHIAEHEMRRHGYPECACDD